MDVVQSALRGEWLLLLAAHTRWIEEPYRVEFKVYAGGEDCGQLDDSLALAGGLDGGVVQETNWGPLGNRLWRGMRVCGTSGAGSERRRLTGENRDGCSSGGIQCFG